MKTNVKLLQPSNGVICRTHSMDSIDGTAVLEHPFWREGKLLVTFTFAVLAQKVSITSPYWVLDTDYESWAIVWSCNNIGPLSVSSGWILTRRQIPTTDSLGLINEALERARIKQNLFTKTNQENCSREWENY
uniref:Uncharacterized protein n=1 Tax=Clastoptera arizonana TaxID=38151 RepID=A0A1B6EEN0_9HEMI